MRVVEEVVVGEKRPKSTSKRKRKGRGREGQQGSRAAGQKGRRGREVKGGGIREWRIYLIIIYFYLGNTEYPIQYPTHTQHLIQSSTKTGLAFSSSLSGAGRGGGEREREREMR